MTTEREREVALIERLLNGCRLECECIYCKAGRTIQSLHESEDQWRDRFNEVCAELERANVLRSAALQEADGLRSRLGRIHDIAGGCMVCSMFAKIMEGVEEMFNLSKTAVEGRCPHKNTAVREVSGETYCDDCGRVVQEQLPEGMVVEDTPGGGSTPRHIRVAEVGSSPAPSARTVEARELANCYKTGYFDAVAEWAMDSCGDPGVQSHMHKRCAEYISERGAAAHDPTQHFSLATELCPGHEWEEREGDSENLYCRCGAVSRPLSPAVENQLPRFSETYCSQCGMPQGPGEHGFSHCADHRLCQHVNVNPLTGLCPDCGTFDEDRASEVTGHG